MWKLLSAELRYNWWAFLAGIVLVPVIVLVADDSLFFMLFIVGLPLSQGVLSVRSSEKRDRLHVLLPVPLHQVGIVRVGAVMVPIVVWVAVFLLVALAAGVGVAAAWRSLLVLLAIFLTIYSIFFLLTDIVLVTVSRARLALLLATLALSGTLLLSLGLWAAMSQGGDNSSLNTVEFLDFLSANNPFAGLVGNLLFLAVSLALASLSVLTFARRRSFASQKA